METLNVLCYLLENQGRPIEKSVEVYADDKAYITENNISVNYEVLRTGEEVWYCSKPSDEDEFMHLVRPFVDECNCVRGMLLRYRQTA